jgi:alpha-L-arabinofuranosidase
MKPRLNNALGALVGTVVLVVAVVGTAGVTPAARVVRPVGPTLPPVELVVSSNDLGTISPYLFGANLLWPYDAEGAFDPSRDRFYPSFVDEVRAVGVTALRYPAGITSDSFDWWRAIGPPDKRQMNEPYGVQAAGPKPCCTLDGPVASAVGPDEFGRLLGQVGAIGTVTVNFISGTAQEAADFVAYMTAPYARHPSRNPSQPSYWAALRAHNGHPAAYDVPYWEVGNEQDGPGQFGWRSGRVVDIGRHKTHCPASTPAVCLYAFGGTTSFSHQLVGTFADEERSASRSTGGADQSFYAYFPPAVPGTETVFVGRHLWQPVRDLSSAGPAAHVYRFDAASARITFGNGKHGAIPRAGDRVTINYQSGPHSGFVEFYAAMKRMNPHIQVCESEEEDLTFLAVMGHTYRYDCVELHKYAKPLDTNAPMTQYEERLMAVPMTEGVRLTALQEAIRSYSGKDIPVVLTEYGQLVEPMPAADPDFNLSLDESLLVASQLRQWVDHNLPLAEKYLLDSAPFLGAYRLSANIDTSGLSVDSAMIAGPGPPFLVEPTGEVMHLLAQLAGAQRLASTVVSGPAMQPARGTKIPVLQSLAASSGHILDILAIDTSPWQAVKTRVDLGSLEHGRHMLASVLDGPSPLAYNTLAHPAEVGTFTRFVVLRAKHDFWWTFPAHSVTLLQLGTPMMRGA